MTSRAIMKNNEGYEGNILNAVHKIEDFWHLFHSLLIYMSHFILGKITWQNLVNIKHDSAVIFVTFSFYRAILLFLKMCFDCVIRHFTLSLWCTHIGYH